MQQGTRDEGASVIEHVLELATSHLDAGTEFTASGMGQVLVLGRVYSFRPDAVPVAVWIHRTVEQVLREHDLWRHGLTLSVDLDYEADWHEGDSPSWPVSGRFVVWGTKALYAGTAVGVAQQIGNPPGDYEDVDAYLEVPRLVIRIDRVGDHAALPLATERFLDEEGESEGGNGCWYVSIAVAVVFMALAVIGLATAVSWVIQRF